jgi:ABC-type nitrate/sulfonate/bicarbonate transport system permease component
MEISILANHLLITLVAWVGGMTLGGGVGYFISGLLYPQMTTKPNLRRMIVLVPWRTVVFTLLPLVWSPLPVVLLGLGNPTGMVIAGLTISLVACPALMKIRLNHWFPPSFRERLISEARTLFLLALLAAIGVGFVGGGGAGFYLMRQMDSLEYGNAFRGFLWLVGIALIVDLIFGVVEYLIGFETTPSH